MKKFVICIEGVGEGCDYTIGCNKLFYEYEIEADSIDDVVLQFHKDKMANMDGEYGNGNYMDEKSEFSYETVYVVEGGLVDISDKLRDMIKKDQISRNLKEAEEAEKTERKLYEKLKRKYDK